MTGIVDGASLSDVMARRTKSRQRNALAVTRGRQGMGHHGSAMVGSTAWWEFIEFHRTGL